jgi:cytoskeletal protein CcmA (bactofilin family)
MWFNKKPDRPQAANPELKNVQTNQPLKSAPGQLEKDSQMNRDAIRPAGESADRAPSRLGSSLHVKGEISGNEDLMVDGFVEGLIQLDERKLTIGTTAKVTADIIVGELVVYGKMKGNVRANGRIEIKKDGSVDGDLTTPQLMIEDGAYFKGSIEIERSAEKEADKSAFPPAA